MYEIVMSTNRTQTQIQISHRYKHHCHADPSTRTKPLIPGEKLSGTDEADHISSQ